MELVIYIMHSKGYFTGYRVKPGMTIKARYDDLKPGMTIKARYDD